MINKVGQISKQTQHNYIYKQNKSRASNTYMRTNIILKPVWIDN